MKLKCKLSETCQHPLIPICALTRKDTPFVWSKECEDAFNTLKKNLSESPCLAYFDSSKEVVIQVDSSKHGIGAVLLQEGCPIEYASRALTPSERNWVQIERVGAGRVSLTSFVLLWSFTLWKLRSF